MVNSQIILFIVGLFTFPTLHQLSFKLISDFLPGRAKSFHLSLATRIVSLFQAICASCVGLRVVTTCQDIMHERYPSINNYTCFALSYFYYDTVAMFLEIYYSHPDIKLFDKIQTFLSKKPLVIAHHIILPTVGFPVILLYRHGIGDFFVACFFIAEISTPFLSVHTILKKLGMERSYLYKVNGVLLAITYFLGRILIFPFMYWSYAKYRTMHILDVPHNIPFFCNLSCLALLLMQSIWFRAIIIQCFKFLTIKDTPPRYGTNTNKIS